MSVWSAGLVSGRCRKKVFQVKGRVIVEVLLTKCTRTVLPGERTPPRNRTK